MEIQLNKDLVETERTKFFFFLWNQLEKEEENLRKDFNIARNLACSRWEMTITQSVEPVQIYPERMKLLNENFDMLLEGISRRRYYLQIAFADLIDNQSTSGRMWANFTYWDNRLHLSKKKKVA